MRQQIDSIPGLWDLEGYDIVLIPSLTYKFYETRNITIIQEERCLELMKLLDNKNSRLIFVISGPLDADIIKHKLSTCDPAGLDPTLSQRIILLSANDLSNRPLTEKILGNEELIKKIRSSIRNREKSVLVPYICSELDDKLRSKIGIPKWLGSAPSGWGSKSSSRQIFAESGVPIAEGSNEPVYNLADLKKRIFALHGRTHAKSIIMKTDDGCGGYGNIVLDFSSFVDSSVNMEDIDRAVRRGVETTKSYDGTGAENRDFLKFLDEIKECGVIVEQMILPNPGLPQSCPSVQLFISDENKVEVLSSHEQVLNGCVYEGCTYPAHEGYLDRITKYAHAAGKALSRKGVRGFFGADFLATQKPDHSWDIIALEINLRLCATTFTWFALLKAVGRENVAKKRYLALDEVKLNRKFSVKELLGEMDLIGVSFDHSRGRGVLLNTLAGMKARNEISVTCVADSKLEVDELWNLFKNRLVSNANTFPAQVACI